MIIAVVATVNFSLACIAGILLTPTILDEQSSTRAISTLKLAVAAILSLPVLLLISQSTLPLHLIEQWELLDIWTAEFLALAVFPLQVLALVRLAM